MALIISQGDPGSVAATAAALLAGRVVIVPTDTVYGIGCLVPALPALERVFRVKNREKQKTLPILVAGPGQAGRLARLDAAARSVARRSWPGAVTLVLPAGGTLPEAVCRENTVALRAPDHDWLRRVIARCGEGLACTSANLSGDPPAGAFTELPPALLAGADLAVDGGQARGIPSKIWDLTAAGPVRLR